MPFDKAERRSSLQRELRGPLLVLLLAVPLFVWFGVRVYDSTVAAERGQREIRLTEFLRARVLRLQLDEETGVRGYTSTGDRLYLQPFTVAAATMPAAFDALARAVARLALPDVQREIAAQRERNRKWMRDVAVPLIARKYPTARSRELQKRGKQLVDDFRNEDQAIAAKLFRAADDRDRRSDSALRLTIVYVVLSSAAIVIGSAIFGFLRTRAGRAAFETGLIVANQRRIAKTLQTAFINRELPVLSSVGLRGLYVPAVKEDLLGGDWYDAFRLPDGRVLFSIGDVAGHGLEAAVDMSRARQTILAKAIEQSDPAAVLASVNRIMLFQHSRMVTAICGYIDPANFEIVYATAGHPPPILGRPLGASYYLPHQGLPLGVMTDATYKTFVACALGGETLVLYTDGAFEHGRDVIAGERALLAATNAAILEDDVPGAIYRAVFGDERPKDDVAILAVAFRAKASYYDEVAEPRLVANRSFET
jgi:serine phosphatase RsbU (regulator of sigma subunit)